LIGFGLASRNLAPLVIAAVLGLAGLWSFETIWIKAGQAVPLS
jgi:hypothetical protein